MTLFYMIAVKRLTIYNKRKTGFLFNSRQLNFVSGP